MPAFQMSVRIQVMGAGICCALFGIGMRFDGLGVLTVHQTKVRQLQMAGIYGPRIYTGPYQHLLHSYRCHQFYLFFSSHSNLFVPEMELGGAQFEEAVKSN